MENTPAARLSRALDSLEGLSVGDAFGEGFFMSFSLAARLMASGQFEGPPYDFEDDFIMQQLVTARRLDLRSKPWRWTDDTALALEIVANLRDYEKIEPDALAQGFSRRFELNPLRGYGGAMHRLLPEIAFTPWQEAAPALFNGTGSFGNGGAMRVAPLGAYFADDPEACAYNAALSSQITHAHPEGVAGGVAVAMAACFAARGSDDLLAQTLPFISEGRVRESLERAQALDQATPTEAALELGSGDEIAAHDTVAFCLWCAARNLDNYEEALWETVEGLGDRDTTCAIVGGIVAARTGAQGIPQEWRENREALDRH